MNGSRVIPYDELASAGSKETAASPWRLLVEFSRALARDDPITHRYLLLLRFILANAIALALVGAAAGQGWIGVILAADEGGLCRAITAVFLVGLVWSGQQAVQLSRGLNELERFAKDPGARAPAYLDSIAACAIESRALLASGLRLRLAHRISPNSTPRQQPRLAWSDRHGARVHHCALRGARRKSCRTSARSARWFRP